MLNFLRFCLDCVYLLRNFHIAKVLEFLLKLFMIIFYMNFFHLNELADIFILWFWVMAIDFDVGGFFDMLNIVFQCTWIILFTLSLQFLFCLFIYSSWNKIGPFFIFLILKNILITINWFQIVFLRCLNSIFFNELSLSEVFLNILIYFLA